MNRIIYSDNGSLVDWSTDLTNYHSGVATFTLVAAEDYIYIGSRLPFNHVYLKFNGANVNSNAATISEIAYWSGNKDWRAAVEIIDETSNGTATFNQDGYITWTTDKDYVWKQEDTKRNQEEVEGLTDITIYDRYWVRLKFSADLSAGVQLQWAGNIFSNDDDLGSEYPDLVRSNFIDAIESGKTDYEEQHIRAANIIIKDLTHKNTIVHRGQILDWKDLTLPSVSKVAELVYGMLGDDYRDDKDAARVEYNTRLNTATPKVDIDGNARVDDDEIRIRPGTIIR